jgi:hypothetical protein
MIVLVALPLLAAACSKSPATSGATTAPTTGATTGATTAPTTGATTGGATTAPTTSPGSTGGSVRSELESLGGDWAHVQAKVSYSVQAQNSASPSPSPISELTLFWKPPSSLRMDIGKQGQVEETIIQTGTTTYECSAQEHACLQSSSSQGASAIPFFSLFANPQALLSQIKSKVTGLKIVQSNETIAGQQASCFTASGTVKGKQGTAEWCFSSSGILLLFQGQSQSSTGGTEAFKIQATAASPQVSDSDFHPPYPVKQIPTVPAG